MKNLVLRALALVAAGGLAATSATALPPNVERIAGSSRYATAAAFALDKWAPGVPVAYVVTGTSFPDALAAAPAASQGGGPVLLTGRDALPPETASALDALNPATIVVVGGTGAVSSGVVDALESYAGSGTVERVAGTSRYDTAARLSQRMFPGADPQGIFIASGEHFADALGAAAAAAVAPQWPLLLTGPDALPAETAAELLRLAARTSSIYVVGGTAAISNQVVQQIEALSPFFDVDRIAGLDRYTTATLLATMSNPPGPNEVVVATGTNFPDGLVAAAFGQPLLLLPADTVPHDVATALQALAPTWITVMGGTGAITDLQVQTLTSPATIIGG